MLEAILDHMRKEKELRTVAIEPHSVKKILRHVFIPYLADKNHKKLFEIASGWISEGEMNEITDYLMMFYAMNDKTFAIEVDGRGCIPLSKFLQSITLQLNTYLNENVIENQRSEYSSVISNINRFSRISVVKGTSLSLNLKRTSQARYPASNEVQEINSFKIV
jgi:hypothetical protein